MTHLRTIRLFSLAVFCAAILSGCNRPAACGVHAAAPTSSFEHETGVQSVTRVYYHTFETAPGDEWSDKIISKTPKGGRPFLGEFPTRKPVTLTLTKLPPHSLVRVTFDLYLFNGWNGSSPYWGFGRWDLDLADGRNLIHTSFSNCGEDDDRLNIVCPHDEQAFPDTYPIRIHPAFTGSAEQHTLRPGAQDPSSVYHFVLTFPHSDKQITFGFHSVIQEGNNRTWGLANLSVETLPAPPLHTEAELAQLWKALGDIDATKAFAAQWELAVAGDQGVEFVAKHRGENIDSSGEDIDKLIRDLETIDPANLSGQLDKIAHEGTPALRPLRAALAADALTPEYKSRLDAAFYITKRQNAPATELRLFRATQLLEIIHTPAALALKLTIPEPTPRNVDAPNPVPQSGK